MSDSHVVGRPTRDPWVSVDPLGEALHLMRMSGVFYTVSRFTAPWGLALPPMKNCLMFHVVTSGRCWLEVDGAQPRSLAPGSLALVPHGEGHRLVSEPGGSAAALFDLPREQLSERYEILRHGGGGQATRMVCGAVRFDHPAAEHLVTLLPRMICIDSWNATRAEWLQSTLHLMAAEAKDLQPGGETVITRLADVLVVQAIRSWIAENHAAHTGWLGALHDPQIGRAILLVHRDPARAWTVESLAAETGMSRSAFAARFKERVGESPMHYVTRWRMLVATKWLHEEDSPLSDLAGRLGYQSEAAFSRAFKRFVGVSPGAVRRSAAGDRRRVGP